MSNKSQYAHLLGSKKAGTKECDENESEHMESPPADDKEDGKKAKGKKAKASEGDENDEDDEADDTKKEKEGKKAKASEDEDEKEDKKSKKAAASSDSLEAAVLGERARCEKIFKSEAATGRPHVAAQFAFHTDMSADSAIAVMEATLLDAPAAKTTGARKSIDERMAAVPSANVGADADASVPVLGGVSESQVKALPPGQKALMIVNAGRKNRGEEPLKQLPAA